jgi:hypothetical protein
LAGQPLAAQETTQPRTHTVVRGDNLWDLSQRYLGNPFLWPEIYRLNRDVVEDPHWIYPGEVLRLPGETTIAQAPPADTGAVPRPAAPAVVDPTQETVFTRQAPPQAGTGVVSFGVAGQQFVKPTVRLGQVIAAPYVDREGGPRGFGRIEKSGDIPGIAAASDRETFQAYDRVFIAPPPGHIAAEGERYLAYRHGPILEQGQIIIPTGIVEVYKAAGSSTLAVAKVVSAFQEMSVRDRLIPLDTAGAGTTQRPVRIADGAATKIRWISGEPVLPGVQSFVVLGLTSQQGIRMGDEFLIFQPGTKPEEGRLGDPEIPISRVQVVRATPYGVTAVVLGVEQPAIKEGMDARVVAKMP